MTKCTHEISCDDCWAEDRGIVLAPDQDGKWYAFYAHDTYGDGNWKGASYQVVAGPAVSESAIQAISTRKRSQPE
jgi:hypothetical protein